MGKAFWKWLVFGVVLGLLPIGFNLMYVLTIPKIELSWAVLFGRGELLLLAVGLCGGALGDLVLMKPGWGTFKLVATGFCVIDVAAASAYFMIVSGRYALEAQPDSAATVIISMVLYAVAVVSSGLCVLVKGEDDDV